MSITADVMDGRGHRPHHLHDYGDQALLLEFESTAEVLAWTDAVREAELLGVLDIVPASRTVLIKLAGPRYQAPTRQRLASLQVAADALSEATAPDGRADVEIEVVYDGEDLDEVARLTGLTPDQVVAAHTGTLWRVGFGGFAPGFAYLIGGDSRLAGAAASRAADQGARGGGRAGRRVQRRVSAGVAGRLAVDRAHRRRAVGRRRDPPALLTPGMWVQFRAVGRGTS